MMDGSWLDRVDSCALTTHCVHVCVGDMSLMNSWMPWLINHGTDYYWYFADGEVDSSEATMAASSSGEGFWFSDSRNYHHEPDHHASMMGVMDDEEHYGDEDGYLPYVYSMEGGDPGVNWEERCLELEMSLQRFRDQAGKIRGLLREKVRSPPVLWTGAI